MSAAAIFELRDHVKAGRVSKAECRKLLRDAGYDPYLAARLSSAWTEAAARRFSRPTLDRKRGRT